MMGSDVEKIFLCFSHKMMTTYILKAFYDILWWMEKFYKHFFYILPIRNYAVIILIWISSCVYVLHGCWFCSFLVHSQFLKTFSFKRMASNLHTLEEHSSLTRVVAGCYVDRTNIFILAKLYHFTFFYTFHSMMCLHIRIHVCGYSQHSTHDEWNVSQWMDEWEEKERKLVSGKKSSEA